MSIRSISLFFLIVLLPVQLEGHSAKKSSRISIMQPVNDMVVTNPVTVQFKTKWIDIAAIGVKKHETGHVILLVNTEVPDLNKPVPMDAQHIHLLKGENEVTIALPVGKNRLQAMLLDEEHEIFEDWLISEPITIRVKPK